MSSLPQISRKNTEKGGFSVVNRPNRLNLNRVQSQESHFEETKSPTFPKKSLAVTSMNFRARRMCSSSGTSFFKKNYENASQKALEVQKFFEKTGGEAGSDQVSEMQFFNSPIGSPLIMKYKKKQANKASDTPLEQHSPRSSSAATPLLRQTLQSKSSQVVSSSIFNPRLKLNQEYTNTILTSYKKTNVVKSPNSKVYFKTSTSKMYRKPETPLEEDYVEGDSQPNDLYYTSYPLKSTLNLKSEADEECDMVEGDEEGEMNNEYETNHHRIELFDREQEPKETEDCQELINGRKDNFPMGVSSSNAFSQGAFRIATKKLYVDTSRKANVTEPGSKTSFSQESQQRTKTKPNVGLSTKRIEDREESQSKIKKEKEEIMALLDSSFSKPPVDALEKQVSGKKAYLDFYKHYKILDKVVDQNKCTDQKSSLYTSVLGKSETCGVLPLQMNFVKWSGPKYQLDLWYFFLFSEWKPIVSWIGS